MDRYLDSVTMQEIQLELIRRSVRNNFEGERVYKDLKAIHSDWVSVIFDSCTLNLAIPPSGLYKLRDLADDIWNADTLYLLAPNESAAARLSGMAEQWDADEVEVYDQRQTQHALGGCDAALRLVTMWWD